MRRFFTLVCLLCLAIPAGISISGCTRNPAGNYCNGLGYGLKDTDVASIFLQPQTTGISIAFGQTVQVSAPSAKTCKGTAASVSSYTYGTTNNQLVDISPTGNICAGTWNRNTGGGIANYTTCTAPNPLPNTGGLPYGSAYITASANSVSSNPVQVFVHAQVTSVTLALSGAQKCYSQTQLAQLDAQACYVGSNNTQQLLCAPSTVTQANYACPVAANVSSVPNCSAPLGTLNFQVGTPSIASINNETNQITAQLPGTTVISASVAGGSSLAGYFSTCPPKSIQITLANGSTSGTITQGITQNLTTTVLDTNSNPITGLSLDYQSTDPIDISAGTGGAITTSYAGEASVYAICQPTTCNPAPINETGLYGTGLSISSNPVTITTPGTASDYVWYSAPGQSQYFVPVELLTGTVGSPARLPYVPNSMLMDRTGTSLYFGSTHALMIFTTSSNTLSKSDTSVPGVVLAVAPNNSQILINDPIRQVFYLYSATSGVTGTFGGVGNSAQYTPDSKTLYITGTNTTGRPTLFVYNVYSGWTTYDISSSGNSESVAITIPSVGAFLSGNPTVAHTWCPSGSVGNAAAFQFYPEPANDSVNVNTDVLAATTDGKHILGATVAGGAGPITLSDIGVTVPTSECPGAGTNTLSPLSINSTLITQAALNVNATAVNQVVTSPASNLAFITYNGPSAGATLPYYQPTSGGTPGAVNYLTLNGSAAITAPLVGAFSPDDTLFFVSTAGDNLVHYINVQTLKDSQQIAPNLPACTTGGIDLGCTYSGSGSIVPATAIAVKPRSTT